MKIDLSDTSFLIPCFNDSTDRSDNIDLTVKMLKDDFDCKIIVGENQSQSFSHLGDKYIPFKYKDFHRTRLLNQMAYKATTPIIVNWDTDVVIPPLQVLEAVRLIRSGYDMVYPYDGRFARVPRIHYQNVSSLRDIGVLSGNRFNGTGPKDQLSVGGAIVFNRESFISGGMENEKFISYGSEDKERYHRFTTLGYKVARIPGVLYHIDHKITINSSMQQPHFKANENEWERVSKMNETELRIYVDNWDFTSNYPEEYQDEIRDTTSAKEVLSVLEDWIDFKTIVDVGCGSGSWDTGKYKYLGIDHNVPNPPENYMNWDLRQPLPYDEKCDLAISVEVAEHLPQFAERTLIQNLTQLSDQVLFSAAIPGQDGENHINLRWQSYWAELFKEFGYYPYYRDIRTPLWNNSKVAPWYRQNMVLYTKNEPTREYELDKVHPEMYLNLLK